MKKIQCKSCLKVCKSYLVDSRQFCKECQYCSKQNCNRLAVNRRWGGRCRFCHDVCCSHCIDQDGEQCWNCYE